jgi:hypothetical protein
MQKLMETLQTNGQNREIYAEVGLFPIAERAHVGLSTKTDLP